VVGGTVIQGPSSAAIPGEAIGGAVAASRRLVVGFVSRYPPVPCGIGEYTRALAEALLGVEPRLRVVVYSTTEPGREPYRVGGVLVRPCYERGSPSYDSLLRCLGEDGGVDVLHLSHEYGIYGDGPGVFDALLEARERGLASAVVATLHTVYHPRGLEGGREERLAAQSRAAGMDAVVVHSVLQEHELRAQGFPPERLHLIPHGTEPNPYLGRSPDKLLEDLGIDPAGAPRPRIVTPGFLRPDKGLATLLEVAARLRSRGLRASFIVAGSPQGRAVARVERLAREAAERGELVLIERYLGRGELQMLAAASDLVLLPYRDRPGKYSVSGVLHDAMAAYRPIAGTRAARLVELEQYAPGMTAPPGDAEALAALAARALGDPEHADQEMSGLYAYTPRTYWSRVARRHLSLYQDLLSPRA